MVADKASFDKVISTAKTAFATSCAVANLSKGVLSFWFFRKFGSKFLVYSPSTKPGDTETTLILGANARAKERVIESKAAFDAQ